MENRKPKLLIIGHGRHGKDTAAGILAIIMSLKFTSSSLFVAKEIIWDDWGVHRYKSFDNMYNDRSNHRAKWADMITEYNTPDKTKTASTMLNRGNHMYVGMRRRDELEACIKNKIFDYIIWIDATDCLPLEDSSSMELTEEDSDFTIDNNGDIIDLDDIKFIINEIKTNGFNASPNRGN